MPDREDAIRNLAIDSVEIGPSEDGYDLLRPFWTAISMYDPEHGTDGDCGTVKGWIGWRIVGENVAGAGDDTSTEIAPIADTAQRILTRRLAEGVWIDTLLVVALLPLDERWRGLRLTKTIIGNLMNVLRLDPGATLVVLHPQPQRPGGGPMDEGPERDAAMLRLQHAYKMAGSSAGPGRTPGICRQQSTSRTRWTTSSAVAGWPSGTLREAGGHAGATHSQGLSLPVGDPPSERMVVRATPSLAAVSLTVSRTGSGSGR
jgi:hypothetical protein